MAWLDNIRNAMHPYDDDYIENEDSDHIPRMNLYGGTLLAFHAGVIAECVLWAMGWGSYTILPVLLPAALAFVWQRQDFRMRERIEEAFEPHHTA